MFLKFWNSWLQKTITYHFYFAQKKDTLWLTFWDNMPYGVNCEMDAAIKQHNIIDFKTPKNYKTYKKNTTDSDNTYYDT